MSGASSYFVSVELRSLEMTPASDAAGREAQCDMLGRYIYHLGLAEATVGLSSEHFCRAAATVTDLPPTAWRNAADQLLDRGERLRNDLRDIHARSGDRASASRARATTCMPQPTPVSVHDAMVRPARYLTREQDADGLWGDFLLRENRARSGSPGYVG